MTAVTARPDAAAADRPADRAHFRADIQGLRAIAVLSVVLYHVDSTLLPGGFAGVDIFFVISGFLITGILARELDQGRFSILRFYERRVRRLFPALFTMLAVVMLAGALILSPTAYEELGRTALATVFFVSNIEFWQGWDYFDGNSAFKPLLHTWSLAVEEQFYILFPLFLLAFGGKLRKWLLAVIVIGFIGATAVALWGGMNMPKAAFYLAPFRAFELLMGAMIALLPPLRLSPRVRDAVSLTGLALIIGSLFLVREGVGWPGITTLAPCGGAALVLLAGRETPSLGGRAISWPVLTFFGAISYSLYLWHWPVLVLGDMVLHLQNALLQHGLLVGFSVLAAWLSWRFIEQPVLHAKIRLRNVLAGGAVVMAASAGFAGGLMVIDGAPQRFPAHALRHFEAANDFHPRRAECHDEDNEPFFYEDACVYGDASAAPDTAVWGDSHGAELAAAIGERLGQTKRSVLQITSSTCAPAVGYQAAVNRTCIEHNDHVLAGLVADKRVKTVIMTTFFRGYPQEDHPALMAGYAKAADALTDAGKRLVLVGPIPMQEFDPPSELGMRALQGRDLTAAGKPLSAYLKRNKGAIEHIKRVAAEEDADIVWPTETFCDSHRCGVYHPAHGGLYINHDHITLTAARLLVANEPELVAKPNG